MNLRERAATQLRNAWAVSWLGDGVETPQPHPAEVVYDAPHAQLRRFTSEAPQRGRPVLLVPPLAVPASCWDLRPGQSLATHLADGLGGVARPTYVIDYGDMGFGDRRMGFEDWIDSIIPTAVSTISARHGGSPVHLVGWSLGGTIALLTAAHATLPLASVTALGTPIDYQLNASSQPLRWLDKRLGTTLVTLPTAALGGVPSAGVQLVYRALAPRRQLTKPFFLLQNLHDTEALARSEAIDRFMGSMPGYPARLYHQMHARLIVKRELATGVVHLSKNFTVDLSRLTTPLTFIGSTSDAIASTAAVEAGVRAFPNARQAQYFEVGGLSHLGLVAGTDANEKTWPIIDRQLAAYDRERPTSRRSRRGADR